MADIQQDRLEAAALSVGYGGRAVLDQVSLGIPNGKITALIGANGSGKSTLLRTLGHVLDPVMGTVLLDGKDIIQSPRKAVARVMALLPQSPVAPDGLTVRQLCRFGRYPHKPLLARTSDHDETVVDEALAAAGLTDLADRALHRLSGGQRQRAWIAMALAQETPILLLDEPTTYLDIAHQMEVLQLLRQLNREQGRTVVMVVHDLNHAAQFAHHIIAVANGGIHAAGAPQDLLTPELIRTVFGVSALVVPHPSDGTPLCLPLPASA
ncbi:iron-dicitrate transporter ATP-binding subunit [Devosia epidermidihirudinis]|uniref:Iron-dicitrate transporter ATP-binding subunit n=1 Tax=Devosia epidermidihirudinis TaxID=1293439 RepID=A0A0F5QGY1_9HYPH|nr:ABC transporter ATP-binding protein [Devosia epidermidihirudinis]KKC39279.1 iron-dicitrate transporter ATP-binding subunit [Devosia epidermidihirudinis]